MVDSSPDKRGEVAYVDPMNPGIVRFHGGDAFDGVLAGTRAQMIVDALNASAASHALQSHVEAPRGQSPETLRVPAVASTPSTTPRSQTIEEAKAVAMKATLCAQIMLQNPVVVANEKARHICVDTRDAANAFLAANPE